MFRFFSILFLCAVFLPRIEAQEWFPYVEAEGRVATDRNVVRGNIFAPVWQSEDSFFFFDIRGLTTNEDANEGNLGFGYRKLVGPDRLVGLFGYYDFRESEFGNQYHQGSLGAEVLSSKWGFRINGYLPQDNIDTVSALNAAILSGNNVFVRQGLEAAYWGADIELERLLWSNTDNGKGGKAPLKVAEFDAEWWASVGYFHFDQSDSRFESISGPRARTELRLWNLPLLGNDSRVMLTGQYEYDDVRGSVGTAGLSVRIPIGRYQSTAAPLSGIRRRMLESVVRDIDIVTNAGAFGDPERAKFARTGELINGTVSVDGNTADPEAVIEGAGDNSLVLASGGAGTIFPAGTIDMNTGQVILGGGSVIGVVGCDTGAHATFTAPGSRPSFRADIIANFAGATNGSIIGVDFGSSLDGSLGLTLTNVNNFLADDVTISTLGINNQGSGITASKSQFTVVNSRIIVPG
ncbi:MAG: inverse autotransporter beta domain-containing protein, partial [Verrucomicrobiota bacterium]